MTITFDSRELIEAFEQISAQSNKITNQLCRQQSWQQDEPFLCSIASSLNDYFYRDGEDGRSTSQCCAVVAGIDADQIRTLNQAKDSFKTLIGNYRAHHPKETKHWQRSVFTSHSPARQTLSETAHGRLNLKACWRRLRFIEQPVKSISYAWYRNGRSIQRIEYQQVVERLERLDRQGVNIQSAWQTLAAIRATTPLCIVQRQAPLIRANVRLGNGEMTAFNSSTPIFLAAQASLPAIRPLPLANEQAARKSRSDQRIEREPLIPMLRLHRYLNAE
ncbi:hypothetical protein [Umboniibacter marinipuniceus]|uniref:DNA replication terminus site binding protein n=1 Tax=Umboniibacter marinipuniceus TaxID=569599 RepID=A0A3M0A9B5_9GAMM|nr:hypothetical protein [Umboniibacter marinipuniceus]RMA81117.1 DNA replication terminus site binding protein [Umboniibacter marinipuniceus]